MVFGPVTTRMHGELFTLQRAAFVDEAVVYATPDVPSLTETFEDFEGRLASSSSFAWIDEGRIVGAVSLRDYRPGGPDIERLMVAPDRRHEGIGARLVAGAERHAFDEGASTIQLIVGEKAELNRKLYRRLGFAESSREMLDGYEDVVLITMTKELAGPRRFSGQVQLRTEDRALGFVRVDLREAVDGSWGGLIQGSDYLMWGGNHQRLHLSFSAGSDAEVVVRATGRLQGIGPVPAAFTAGDGS